MPQPRDVSHHRNSLIRTNTVLCCFTGRVDFDQHIDPSTNARCPFVDLLCQLQRIDRVNQMNKVCNVLNLVRLKMSYEMPANSLIGNLFPFRQELLNEILTDIVHAVTNSLCDHCGIERLRYR